MRYHVRFVHKIAPSEADRHPAPIEVPDGAFSDRKTLAAALRRAGVLYRGAALGSFRVEGERVVAFPNRAGHWHSIILDPAE